MKQEVEVYTKISELKRRLSDLISVIGYEKDEIVEMFFKPDDLSPKFKISIELIDEKFFIDSQGRKWVRADEK